MARLCVAAAGGASWLGLRAGGLLAIRAAVVSVASASSPRSGRVRVVRHRAVRLGLVHNLCRRMQTTASAELAAEKENTRCTAW